MEKKEQISGDFLRKSFGAIRHSVTKATEGDQPCNRKFTFFNVPMYGHVNPSLDLIAELVSRNNKVIYYAGSKFKGAIEATGAEFRDYADVCDVTFKQTRVETNIFNTTKELMEECEIILGGLVGNIEKPDCFVYDVSAIWGKYLGKCYYSHGYLTN